MELTIQLRQNKFTMKYLLQADSRRIFSISCFRRLGGSPDEEARLVKFMADLDLSQEGLDYDGAFSRTSKGAILREILNGEIPQRVTIDGQLPINFQKNECIAWAFANSDYLEDKVKRQFVGRSQGTSIRVMKGVYYRVWGFKGHSVSVLNVYMLILVG